MRLTVLALAAVTASCSGGKGGNTPNDRGDTRVGDFVNGDGDDTWADAVADIDPCANVGCSPAPICGTPCDSPCGCCGCMANIGWCAVEAGAYVKYACDAGGSCITASVCDSNTACAYGSPQTPTCAPAFTVGGTLDGAATATELLLSYEIADASFRVDTLTNQDNGSFVFATGLPDGFSYSVSVMWPTGQKCSVANDTGSIAGANVVNIDIACSSTNPCEATQVPSPHQCMPNPPGCTDYFIFHDLSCNDDGSSSNDLVCCEPTGE